MEPDEIQQYAAEVAAELNETDDSPREQILKMVEVMGKDFVAKKLEETKKIQENGGMMTEKKDRKRTIGGVFFYVAKGDIKPEQRAAIFPNYVLPSKRGVKWHNRVELIGPMVAAAKDKIDAENAAAKTASEAQQVEEDATEDDVSAEEANAAVTANYEREKAKAESEEDEDLMGAGLMRFMYVTLHGLPGDVFEKDESVVTTMEYVFDRAPLPRGVPEPPKDHKQLFTIYMSKIHWVPAKANLDKFSADRLVVEGPIFFDEETQTLAVMAQMVTTKKLLKAKRKAEQAAAQGGPVPNQQNNKKEKGKGKDKAKGKAKQPKNATNNKSGDTKPKQPKPARQPRAEPAAKAAPQPAKAKVEEPVKIPAGAPPDVVKKIEELNVAADKLRTRLADAQKKGGAGASMIQRLLSNTEKQIQSLQKEYS